MTDLDSADAVAAFIQQNGVEPLRRMLAGQQLAGRRKDYVELAVARYDAQERLREQKERDDAGLRAANAAEAQVVEARRAADAAVASAQQSKRAVTHAMISWIVAALALVVSIAAYFK